jgi:hypothetical protein
MAFQPDWRYSATGMFPLPVARHPTCVHCKEPLVKRHGINLNRPGQRPSVMGFFAFGVGPFCIYCQTHAWSDAEFFSRSGHSQYSALNWDLSQI